MKVPLTTRTKYVNAIISLKDKSDDDIQNIINDLNVWCKQFTELYAFILHDKDVLDSGEVITKHIHLVSLMTSNRQRLSTILNDLSLYIGLSPLSISIEKLNDINGSLRYLIHKDNKEKYQYDVNDIVTSLSENELRVYLESDSGSLSIEKLIELVQSTPSKLEIMRTIGLGNYHLYRNVINDIYREVYGTA